MRVLVYLFASLPAAEAWTSPVYTLVRSQPCSPLKSAAKMVLRNSDFDGIYDRDQEASLWDSAVSGMETVESLISNVTEHLPSVPLLEDLTSTLSENVDLEISKERTQVSERRRGLLRRLRERDGAKFSLWTRCRTEFLGTLYIFFYGSFVANLGVGLATTALAWGLAVGSAVAMGAGISGAHYNPAVTCALALGDSFPAREAPAYFLSQYAGASLAGALLATMFPLAVGLPAAAATMSSEIGVTSMLLYGCLALGDGVDSGRISKRASPVLVGGLITFLNIAFVHLRAGINPAMLAAPRIFAALSGHGAATALAGAPIYTLGPILGAILGGCLYALSSGRGVGGSTGLYGALARLGRAISPWYGTHWEVVPEPPRRVMVPTQLAQYSGVVVPTRASPQPLRGVVVPTRLFKDSAAIERRRALRKAAREEEESGGILDYHDLW